LPPDHVPGPTSRRARHSAFRALAEESGVTLVEFSRGSTTDVYAGVQRVSV
jgi:hypothetical protein